MSEGDFEESRTDRDPKGEEDGFWTLVEQPVVRSW